MSVFSEGWVFNRELLDGFIMVVITAYGQMTFQHMAGLTTCGSE